MFTNYMIYSIVLSYMYIPVRAKYMPRLPDRRGRKWDPPTSGNRPIKVSGMAKTVCSVATLNGPWTDSPTPCSVVGREKRPYHKLVSLLAHARRRRV